MSATNVSQKLHGQQCVLVYQRLKLLTSQEVGGRGAFVGCILEECNCCCSLEKVTAVVGNITFYRGNEWACDGDSDSTFHT